MPSSSNSMRFAQNTLTNSMNFHANKSRSEINLKDNAMPSSALGTSTDSWNRSRNVLSSGNDRNADRHPLLPSSSSSMRFAHTNEQQKSISNSINFGAAG